MRGRLVNGFASVVNGFASIVNHVAVISVTGARGIEVRTSEDGYQLAHYHFQIVYPRELIWVMTSTRLHR